MRNLMNKLKPKGRKPISYQPSIEMASSWGWRRLQQARLRRLQQQKRWWVFGSSSAITTLILWVGAAWANGMQDYPVPVRTIQTGDFITAEDLSTRAYDPLRVPSTYATSSKELLGKQAVRPLKSGLPIAVEAVRIAPDLQRNQKVTIIFETAGLKLATPGRLLQDAQVGDDVKVMATDTRKVLDAVAKTQTTVEVY